MTYYETVVLIKEIEKANINEELLNKLQVKVLFYGDVKYRFAIHVIETMRKKIKKSYFSFLDVVTNEIVGLDKFLLGLQTLRNELVYIEKISTSKIIPEELSKQVEEVFDNEIEGYNKFVVNLINGYYSDEYMREFNNVLGRKEVNYELSKDKE